MKKIILAIVIGLTSLLQAQNSIVGTITTTKNQPISTATLTIPSLHSESATDENGKFTLSQVPSGTIKLIVTASGYKSIEKQLTITEKTTTISFILEEAVIHMEEVLVATAFHKLQSQNVTKVAFETVKTLQNRGATSLIEGLSTIPGVSQISTGTGIGKPVIRGLSGNRVVVYTQGVRLENQQFGDEHGLGLNDSGVESVEIIKGPASLLYGSDALGGVLYFNPEKFAKENSFEGDFGQRFFYNTLGVNSTIGLKKSIGKWNYLARGSYTTHSDYSVAGSNRVTNTRFNESDLKTGISYHSSKFSSTVRYNFNALNVGIPENGIENQTISKLPEFPKQQVVNHILSAHQHLYFKNSSLDADFGYVFNDRSEFEDSNEAVLKMKLKTFNYNLKYNLPTYGKIESIIGTQGMVQTNKNYGIELLIPDARSIDFGIFGTTNYDLGKGILQAGLRFDMRKISTEENGISTEEGYFKALEKQFNSSNASLGYKTNIDKKTTLRVTLASGFRAPNLAELTSNGVHEGSNRYEIGNPNLKKEQNIQTDINLEYQTDHFELFVAGFYNQIKDYIFISPLGTTIAENDVYEYTQANAKLYGGEIGLHFHPHPIDWLHLETSFETVTGKKQSSDFLPLIPANKWNTTIRSNFEIKKWLSYGFATLNLSHTFKQNNTGVFETNTAKYTLINLGFGGKIKVGKRVFELNLNGNNLLDKSYFSHLSRLKTDGVRDIGRNIILGVHFAI